MWGRQNKLESGVTRQDNGRQAVALSAERVSYEFVIAEEQEAWRLAFGSLKDLPRFKALEDVSILVPKGKFVGILGRNGAGKTTLLRTLGGAYAPKSGVIVVNGALSGIYELGVAGNPELTGREYADRLLSVNGVSGAKKREMIEEIAAFTELGDRFDDRIQGYSMGMGARLYFAVATAGAHDVYLIDEVLAVGDAYFQAKCWRRIRERLQGGASGVLVTHDWSAVLKVCTEAHILDEGRIAYSGSAEQVVRKYLFGATMQNAYVDGVARIVNRPHGKVRVQQGDKMSLALEVEVLAPAKVGVVCAIEQLRPGRGWEVICLSREPDPIGDRPGLYQLELSLPDTPLAPGEYMIGVGVVTPDPNKPGFRIAHDGFGWLDGTGLTLEVVRTPNHRGLALPAQWDCIDA